MLTGIWGLQGFKKSNICASWCDLITFRYGLIWISTTLVFVLASLGNCATYLMQKHTDKSSSWSYNVGYMNLAACSVYGYAAVVPLAFYFLLQYMGANASLVRFWCMWGYSLFIFILASVSTYLHGFVFDFFMLDVLAFYYDHQKETESLLSDRWLSLKCFQFLLLIPVEILRWIIIILAGTASACFVSINLKSYIEGSDLTVVVAAAFFLQLALAVFIKVWFFPWDSRSISSGVSGS